jgi:hypothetical protein
MVEWRIIELKHRIAPELEPTVCGCEEMRRLLYVHSSRLVGYDG